MTALFNRVGLRRCARLAIAGTVVLAAVQGASADDAGIHQFFEAIFGGAAAPQVEPAPVYAPSQEPAPSYRRVRRDRTLTVRLHPVKPRLVVAERPANPGKISIFEDRTLRRGDAVMTANGIRIFAGSTSWPYSTADFVALDDTRHLNDATAKVLAQLDRMPRG